MPLDAKKIWGTGGSVKKVNCLATQGLKKFEILKYRTGRVVLGQQ